MADRNLEAELEKAKEIFFTDAQRAGRNIEDLPIPSQAELLAKDPKLLTLREANILRYYDTGLNLSEVGQDKLSLWGAKLQKQFPYQKTTGGMAHKSSPQLNTVYKLQTMGNSLKKAGFEKGIDMPLGEAHRLLKENATLGLSKASFKDLSFILNRTENVLRRGEKEIGFLGSLQENLGGLKAGRGEKDILNPAPTAKQFYERHAKVIQNIVPTKNTPAELFKVDTQRAAVNLWGFVGERLEQMMSTVLYVPDEWADKGGLDGFIEHITSKGRSPAYIDASNPVAIIPSQSVYGEAKGYKPIPLSPYFQAIMKDRIRESYKALSNGIIKDTSGSLAIKLFPNVDISTALKRGKFVKVFSDLVGDKVDADGNVVEGMNRDIKAKDNRKIVPSLIQHSDFDNETKAAIINSMHGKQTEVVYDPTGQLDKTSKDRYLATRLIGQNKSSEAVGQIFLLKEQAKALGVTSLNEIPAKAGLGLIPELADEGVRKFDITISDVEERQRVGGTEAPAQQPPQTVSSDDNAKILKDSGLSQAQIEEAISESQLRKETNLTKIVEEKKKRKSITPIVSQTDELLGATGEPAPEAKPKIDTTQTPERLRSLGFNHEEITEFFEEYNRGNKSAAMAVYSSARKRVDGQNRTSLKSRLADLIKNNPKTVKGLAVGLPFVGGLLGAADVHATEMKEKAEYEAKGEEVPAWLTVGRQIQKGEELVSPIPTTHDVEQLAKGIKKQAKVNLPKTQKYFATPQSEKRSLSSGFPAGKEIAAMKQRLRQPDIEVDESGFEAEYEGFIPTR